VKMNDERRETNDERRMTRDEGGKSQRDLEGLGGGSEGALRVSEWD